MLTVTVLCTHNFVCGNIHAKPCCMHKNQCTQISICRALVSNRLSILHRYWFIEKLTSLFSLHKTCSQSVWSKAEINLLLSNLLQLCLKILDFAADNFEKKSCKKINCGRWSEMLMWHGGWVWEDVTD